MDVVFLALTGLLTSHVPRQLFGTTTAATTTSTSTSSTSNNDSASIARDDTYRIFKSQEQRPTSTIATASSSSSTGHNVLFTISFGLSLLLFALSIIELFPQSWLLYMQTTTTKTSISNMDVDTAIRNNIRVLATTTTNDGTNFTALQLIHVYIIGWIRQLYYYFHVLRNMKHLYRTVLWFITIHCMIVIPAAMGIQMMISIRITPTTHFPTESSSAQSPKGTITDLDHQQHNSDDSDDKDERSKKRRFERKKQRSRYHCVYRIMLYCASMCINLLYMTTLRYLFRPIYHLMYYYVLIPTQHKVQTCFYSTLYNWNANDRYRSSTLPSNTTSSCITDVPEQHQRKCFSKSSSNNIFIKCWYDPTIRKSVFYGSLFGIIISCTMLIFVSPFIIEQPQEQKELSVITSLISILRNTTRTNHALLLQQCIKSLCAIGIIISTILNGFGSISLPYSCFVGLFIQPLHKDIIDNAENELQHVHHTLQNKIYVLSSFSNDCYITPSPNTGCFTTLPMGGSSTGSGSCTNALTGSGKSKMDVSQTKHFPSSIWSSSSSFTNHRKIRRNVSDVVTKQEQHRTSTLLNEIEYLENLIDDMTSNVDEMRYAQSISYEARTNWGKIRSYMGVIFSILLLSRLISALSNVGKHYFTGFSMFRSWNNNMMEGTGSAHAVDPVTRLVLLLSGNNVIVTMETLHATSQCISLILTALLSISQIRVFLRTVTTIQRRLNHIYRKCYCRPFRCTPMEQNQHQHYNGGNSTISNLRRSKLKSSISFTEATIASFMKLEQSPKSSGDTSSSADYNHNNSSSLDSDAASTSNIWFLSHPISFLLCCYCLACVVLTKMMLPIEYSTNFSKALFLSSDGVTTKIFTIRTYTIDVIYTITAFISGSILAIILSLMRSNIRRIQYDNHNDSNVIPHHLSQYRTTTTTSKTEVV